MTIHPRTAIVASAAAVAAVALLTSPASASTSTAPAEVPWVMSLVVPTEPSALPMPDALVGPALPMPQVSPGWSWLESPGSTPASARLSEGSLFERTCSACATTIP